LIQTNIRNFCIIAHIDHGKSTLADRLLEFTGALSEREMTAQVLDSMDLERERGITIKAQAVRLQYKAKNGENYILNLIDTPGHVDFTYEVSRSLKACDGALLVVDATQGVEAQTIANLYLAVDLNLDIIPVINKVDLPSAEPDRTKNEIKDIIGISPDECILASAKTGLGTEEILEAIVSRIKPPVGDVRLPLQALIFDSLFDSYRGAIAYVRVMEGRLVVGQKIRMMVSQKEFEVTELGTFRPAMTPATELVAGEVGFVVASMKNVKDVQVGDTITDVDNPALYALPGYRPIQPMVYCGLYPVDNGAYGELRDALEKLNLNDASLIFEPESSTALGFGFRCGFLGLLHMEIVQERLEREYDLNLIATAPSVIYKVFLTNGDVKEISNPAELPAANFLDHLEEPVVKATIILPSEFVGAIMELCQDKRGTFLNMEYLTESRVMLTYELPLAEILMDFFDKLKSRSRGYASLDYEYVGHKKAELVKLDIMISEKVVDALSAIVHRDRAYQRGRQLAEKLKEIIPRQLFEVPIQATIGSKIIARETIKAMRKDVLAKCYGGDISRKRKLLEKQKEGKKRMKQLGSVEVPQEAFLAVLKIED
jgi:GTP-binding protein LepA